MLFKASLATEVELVSMLKARRECLALFAADCGTPGEHLQIFDLGLV